MEKQKGQTIFPVEDSSKSNMQQTADGFKNFAARLGVSPPGEASLGVRSNLISHGHYQFNLMTRNRIQLEAAYRGSWIARKAIDIPAHDMTRAGVDIITNKGAEKIQELKVQMSRLKIWWSLGNTIRWGKLYGGSIGVLQIKGQNPETPLNMDTVGKDQFLGIVTYDRWQLQPTLDQVIETGPDMGLPKFYDIVLGTNVNDPGHEVGLAYGKQATGRVRVHHSRCIRVIGDPLPFFQAITEMMWGEARYEGMWDRLIEYDDAIASTGGLINRAQLRTVGIGNLREILSSGGAEQEALIAQFEYMREFQSSEGLTLLDKEDVFASVAYSFGGLADVLREFKQEIGGGFDIPLVRFFGQSPSGLNATGESDLRLYYDSINAQQEFELRNGMEMVLKCMWRSLYGVAIPDDLTFTFTPLWQLSAKEKAEIGKTVTDSIIEAHQEGLTKKQTAMKELKQASGVTGLFTHMTEEEIEEAEEDEPPMPEEMPDMSKEKKVPEAQPEDPADKIASAAKLAKDSAWTRIKRFLSRDSVIIPNEEFIKEHQRLLAILKKGGAAEKKEAKKQMAELKEKFPDIKVDDRGVEATMREFEKGTLKSSSGKKVTSKKQALAIGYSEERAGDSEVSDAQKIKDWLDANHSEWKQPGEGKKKQVSK